MEHHTVLFVNTALVIACTAMAIVFLVLPLPPNKGLNNFRISLRFLAGAYLTLALLKIVVMTFEVSLVNYISIERLTISSLQAALFAIALITLLKPQFNTTSYLYKQLIPVLILNILYLLVSNRWGNPRISSYSELNQYAFHPAMLIRELFLLYYIFQIVYLTRLFIHQARLFENKVDNYFADNLRLHLPGVRYSYCAVLSIGIGALLSCFILTELWLMLFTSASAVFYLGFGIYYIQYPRTFIFLEPAIYIPEYNKEELARVSRRIDWGQLKMQILKDKYYLRDGVNIEEMARHLKIGRTSLSTLINNDEGMNFNLWINKMRIDEAKYLLVEYPNYTLAQIAELIGYSEPSNFSRQFKQITAESPSTWRQTHRVKDSLLKNSTERTKSE
jgi:AraC-like DNA-binding protein